MIPDSWRLFKDNWQAVGDGVLAQTWVKGIIFREVIVVCLRLYNRKVGEGRKSVGQFKKAGKGPVNNAKLFYDLKKKTKNRSRTKQFSFSSHECLSKFRFLILDFRICLYLVSPYLTTLLFHYLPATTLFQIDQFLHCFLNRPHCFLALEPYSWFSRTWNISSYILCSSSLIL